MRHSPNKLFTAALTIIFALSATGCATYKAHPDFKERHKNIKSASLMPPEVDAYVLTFKGEQKRLHDLIPIMEKTTIEELEKTLAEKGYEVKKLDLSEAVLQQNPDLRTSLFHVNEAFKKQLIDISKCRQKKFTYSLGSEVNVFAELADDCDILVFVKEEGIKKSAGEVAKDMTKALVLTAAFALIGGIYVPIPQFYATIVNIAIVDSNDGAILWYNASNPNNSSVDPENQKYLGKLVKSLLNKFPDSAFKKEKSKN